MFNLAARWHMRADNPVKGVEKNAGSTRKRYLAPDEIKRLAAALKAYRDQRMADYFRLLLLTGAWEAICGAAKIENLRTHDLRHSFASQVISSGQSLAVVGSLLGHTQPATSARYSHLYDEVTRAATNRAARTDGRSGQPPSPQKGGDA
jgi:integrase